MGIVWYSNSWDVVVVFMVILFPRRYISCVVSIEKRQRSDLGLEFVSVWRAPFWD